MRIAKFNAYNVHIDLNLQCEHTYIQCIPYAHLFAAAVPLIVILFDLILYVPSTIFQLLRVEPVLS